MLLWILSDTGVGLLFGGPLISGAIKSYQELEEAEYLVTHYKGEGAIKNAMEMAKDARNYSIKS
ncbi:hypothetical protein TK0920 [Thermococcus kodakarensis KOD1]|uniref:Uncharacterized protein n=2 Tax=Thermococcus TaxID=2263 RepID=Q5JI65_THEKO|nr:hypothetical protein TK0920 [Thermococcus kodakarensis KOD1]